MQHARLAEALTIAEDKAENLLTALDSSRQIGAGIGILMSRYLITGEAAFELLRAASQRSNCKLRDIAADVIDTGELPALTRSPSTQATTARPHLRWTTLNWSGCATP